MLGPCITLKESVSDSLVKNVHFILWEQLYLFCSSLHKEAGIGPVADLKSCSALMQQPNILVFQPLGRHSKLSCNITYGCAILGEMNYLQNLNGLLVLSHINDHVDRVS